VSERLVLISSDCHAGASILGYREYLTKQWHSEFDDWAAGFADPWKQVEENDIKLGVASFDSEISWNSEYRQRILEADGIVGEVLFPNTAPPFFPSGVLSVSIPQTQAEYERRMAGLRAHNSWIADFCSELPGRRIGVAQVFLNNVEDTVAELERIKRLGLNSVLLPADTQHALVPLYPRHLDPVWAKCEELGIVVHKHVNFAGDAPVGDLIAGGVVGLLEQNAMNYRGVAHLLVAGVFERFPSLKFVQTETGVSWLPGYLAACDGAYEAAKIEGGFARVAGGPAVDLLPKRPSEYFKTNCWIGASLLSPAETAARADVGVDRIMWGSDLPHYEGTYPYTAIALRALFADIPVDDVKLMTSGNAATVYGFDLDKLQKVADKIGPKWSDVQIPIAEKDWPSVPDQTQSPTFFATAGA
jgi:predicted TIM-barrel fold metal-dependent hydrolase